MKDLLLKSGIEFDRDLFIHTPGCAKRVTTDVGLSENTSQS